MATAKKSAGKVPTKKSAAATDVGALFWQQIEDAWAAAPRAAQKARKALINRDPDDDDADSSEVDDVLDDVIDHLRETYAELPQETLAAIDAFLERKLYDIDRLEIQEVTDGSDDGFLYARGFIVAMGKEFYDAVRDNAAMAICDAELEAMCYLPANVYEERFGESPKSGAGISRETCSNPDGWPKH